MAGLGFSLSPTHIPLCYSFGLVWSGPVWFSSFSPTSSFPARRAQEGVGLVISPCTSISYGYFIISLAIPETGRVIAMSKIYCRSVGGHIWCPFFVSLFPQHDFKGSNGINRAGVKDGDRETVLTLGLRPGQRELDHLRSDSAC